MQAIQVFLTRQFDEQVKLGVLHPRHLKGGFTPTPKGEIHPSDQDFPYIIDIFVLVYRVQTYVYVTRLGSIDKIKTA